MYKLFFIFLLFTGDSSPLHIMFFDILNSTARVLEKLGFSSRWVNLVMKCITSVSYSVIINGATSGNIVPTWGLRQGDPLSPILFLIYTEGLSALINKATRNQLLTSISICRGYPRVTHLLFADDSILFCKASAGIAGS